MKTKLLRKIRKQYSIVYYPQAPDYPFSNPYFYKYAVGKFWLGVFKKTKQECLNYILNETRKKYKKYSRNYKSNNNKPIKIWHNSK